VARIGGEQLPDDALFLAELRQPVGVFPDCSKLGAVFLSLYGFAVFLLFGGCRKAGNLCWEMISAYFNACLLTTSGAEMILCKEVVAKEP